MSRATACLSDTEHSQDRALGVLIHADTRQNISAFTRIINLWNERSKQRRQLLELADDPVLLKDLGLSNYDVRHEGRKSFWRK